MNHHEKTHFFRDDQDNRVVVHTAILPDGSYEADTTVDNVDNCPERLFGYGTTRLEAIADLQLHLVEYNQ
jgi:hypothetical protein